MRAATDKAEGASHRTGVPTSGTSDGARSAEPKGPSVEAARASADPAPSAAGLPRSDDAGRHGAAATLSTPVASDTSNPEDPVRATLQTPVTIGGVQALPAGTVLIGHVTDARAPPR